MKFRTITPVLLALAAFLLAPLATFSQAPEPPARAGAPPVGPTIRSIEIQYAGPETVSRQKILANMRTQVGRPYSESSVEEDIRSLYATGNISNVRIFGEPQADGVKVIVVVAAKSQVSEVVVNGVSAFKPTKIRKEITTKVGATLNEATVEADRQKVIDYYHNHGFADATVTVNTALDEKSGKARVEFTVSEGGKMIVRDIIFEGNDHASRKDLNKVVKTHRRTIMNFLTKAGRLDADQVDEDVTALRDYYQNHGFLDVRIDAPKLIHTGQKVDVVFPIVEGPQYHVGRIEFAHAQVYTPEELAQDTKLKSGDIYSPAAVKADLKKLQDLYGARGYVDFQAGANTTPLGDHVMNLTYSMEEGNQSYVEHINITGNKRTKDKVIRREIALAPGELFNTPKVDASKQRLQNTNYFQKVDAYPVDTLVPGRKDLNVIVEEKRTGSFNFGAGFSSIDSLLGFAEITQSNFDLFNYPRFTGGGQKFRIRIQYGVQRKDAVISLTEPYFLDYKLSLGGEIFYREANFVSNVYDERRYGFSLTTRKALTDFTAFRFGYKLEDVGIQHLTSNASDYIRNQVGSRLESQVNAGINYDSRDSVFLTRHGMKIDLSTYVDGGPLGGATQIVGFDLEATRYFLLPWDTILTINGEAGVVSTWGGGDKVPIWDRLYLGGANNLRGYKYRYAGPKDNTGEPIGGDTLLRGTIEYTYPIIDKVRGAVFYDVGYVNQNSYVFVPEKTIDGSGGLNHDIGIGFRIDLPIGPVRIDYGIPLSKDQFLGSGGKFNFNIGYQF